MASIWTHGSPVHKIRYVNDLNKVGGLGNAERDHLGPVCEKFAFRANDYYLNLIDWSDPDDPIRRLIIPNTSELESTGQLDPCCEGDYTPAPGLQHKYRHTALLLTTQQCGGFCRYCFRKRLFMDGNGEVAPDPTEAIEYIRSHPEITNVLLTGGDPLLLPTEQLGALLQQLDAIPHVRIIRIGSKMPAFNPYRILDDPELQALLRHFSRPSRRIYLMTHFDHPRELTKPARQAIGRTLRAGVVCANQCPILAGVNDNIETQTKLFRDTAAAGCPQYYSFIVRPTAGNRPFQTPIVKAWQIFNAAQANVSGLAKRARLVMSHATGKIHILAVDEQFIYMRYHRAGPKARTRPMMIYRRDDDALWLDDLQPIHELAEAEQQ